MKPTDTSRLCANCKRNLHYRCTGNWRANHGLKGPCECTSPEHGVERVGTHLAIAPEEDA